MYSEKTSIYDFIKDLNQQLGFVKGYQHSKHNSFLSYSSKKEPKLYMAALTNNWHSFFHKCRKWNYALNICNLYIRKEGFKFILNIGWKRQACAFANHYSGPAELRGQRGHSPPPPRTVGQDWQECKETHIRARKEEKRLIRLALYLADKQQKMGEHVENIEFSWVF